MFAHFLHLNSREHSLKNFPEVPAVIHFEQFGLLLHFGFRVLSKTAAVETHTDDKVNYSMSQKLPVCVCVNASALFQGVSSIIVRRDSQQRSQRNQ